MLKPLSNATIAKAKCINFISDHVKCQTALYQGLITVVCVINPVLHTCGLSWYRFSIKKEKMSCQKEATTHKYSWSVSSVFGGVGGSTCSGFYTWCTYGRVNTTQAAKLPQESVNLRQSHIVTNNPHLGDLRDNSVWPFRSMDTVEC